MLLTAILSGYALAIFAPFLVKRLPNHAHWLIAVLPAVLFGYFVSLIAQVNTAPIIEQNPWVDGLGLSLTMHLDGLALLMSLLITGIGSLIMVYAGAYLHGHAYLGRFYVFILSFMASMLGLVLSNNLLAMFIFWELTSITSYMLIGFDHESEDARSKALQGLFITVSGGLCLMAGLILLSFMAGSYEISDILAYVTTADITASPYYTATVILILLGAFTKSAQFPFYFWLPNAMAAPTPVSAYLHSATMVKAGIYLMARLTPVLGAGVLWQNLLMGAGAITLLLGVYLAYSASDVKKVLAYSTIMALGVLTLLLGIAATGVAYAFLAFVTFLLAHSLYKGAMFMLAGIIDHNTGTKDISKLSGLRTYMPKTAVVVLIAGLSLAGIPPLFGFIAKELLLEATLNSLWQITLTLAAFIMACLGVAVAALVAIRPFWGKYVTTPYHAKTGKAPIDAEFGLILGPVVLAGLSLLFGLMPSIIQDSVLDVAMLSVAGTSYTASSSTLALWHGINTPLMISLASMGVGVVLYLVWHKLHLRLAVINTAVSRIGPERGYFVFMDNLPRFALWQTDLWQNGKLNHYLATIMLFAFGLAGGTLLYKHHLMLPAMGYVTIYEAGLAIILLISSIFAAITFQRLFAVAILGAMGFSVALIFIHFSAPDLGITQLMIEILTVVLLVLVLAKLPDFTTLSSRAMRFRDVLLSGFAGLVIMAIMLNAIGTTYFPSISEYMVANSYELAHGRNIVNVILVDFRVLDTLGEGFVLAIAAIGVYSMIKLVNRRDNKPVEADSDTTVDVHADVSLKGSEEKSS